MSFSTLFLSADELFLAYPPKESLCLIRTDVSRVTSYVKSTDIPSKCEALSSKPSTIKKKKDLHLFILFFFFCIS
jgi:hypothetical protein